jgi:hypothetical protein
MKRLSFNWLVGLFCLVIVSVLAASTENTQEIELTQDPMGNFTLSVSNQSTAIPVVDISVMIDGRLAISDSFSIGSGHNVITYRFSLPKGKHELTALTSKGQTQQQATFSIQDKHWMTIIYWFHPEENSVESPGSGSLQFEISDSPIRFK